MTQSPQAPDLEWPLRVLIVDDAASTRLLLRTLLEHAGGFDVCGEADNGDVAVELAADLQPDVVLLDLSMPVAGGSGALSDLLAVAPRAKVIILSGMDPTVAAPLADHGATAFIPKGLPPFELLDRLQAALGRAIDPSPPEVPPTPMPPTPEPPPRDEGLPQAVICDDDPTTRRLVGRVLETCALEVVAETAMVPALLAAVRAAQPDLIVLDLWLEGTSGTSALPEISRLSPATRVVVYSGHETWADDARAAGAHAFVAKPDFRLLEETIRRLLATSV